MRVHYCCGIGFLVLASLLTGCSTNKVSDLYRLQPIDTADLSKRFTYGFSVRGPGVGPQPQGGENPGGGGLRQRDQTANFVEMREELENYMAVTGYCTQGYFIYDETFNGVQYLLHGECQESKNDE